MINKISNKELDDLFRLCIRKRDDYNVCPLCNEPFGFLREEAVNHFVKRRFLNTRWSLENAIKACFFCNGKDISIEPILKQRGINTELVKKKGFSMDYPDREQIYFELTEYLYK